MTSEPEVRAVTGVDRAWRDAELISCQSRPAGHREERDGRGARHRNRRHARRSCGPRIKNVKLADTQSVSVGFNYPLNSEDLPNTDQLYGHGTFVAGVIAGNGSLSGGKFSGVAPGRASGWTERRRSDACSTCLSGFDYLLANGRDLGVRVVNCSFSANTLFDTNDPVNVATRMLTDAGINVVFSAGNTGPGPHTLESLRGRAVGRQRRRDGHAGRLASFSSRGDFAQSAVSSDAGCAGR